jgi:hypothetical protein
MVLKFVQNVKLNIQHPLNSLIKIKGKVMVFRASVNNVETYIYKIDMNHLTI